jgi:hypothetical protein
LVDFWKWKFPSDNKGGRVFCRGFFDPKGATQITPAASSNARSITFILSASRRPGQRGREFWHTATVPNSTLSTEIKVFSR